MTGSDDETRAALERAARGDETAVQELLDRYRGDLELYLRRHAGAAVLARESGADLAQSVCREVLERLADERFEYRGEAAFREWLYRAAELKLKNRHRFWGRDKRDPGREARRASSLGALLHQSLASPSGAAVRREETERLEAAFGRLDERGQEVVRLAYVEGLSHKEIGARLGIEESHSRTLLARAKARLARLASEEGA